MRERPEPDLEDAAGVGRAVPGSHGSVEKGRREGVDGWDSLWRFAEEFRQGPWNNSPALSTFLWCSNPATKAGCSPIPRPGIPSQGLKGGRGYLGTSSFSVYSQI